MNPWGLKSWLFTGVAIAPVLLIASWLDHGRGFWWIVLVGAWPYAIGIAEGLAKAKSQPEGP